MTTDAKASVLLVEDNPANLKLYERVISDVPNCVAASFTSPIEALSWASEHRVDFVIVDYRMPIMDGLAFIRGFRAIPNCEHVPIVMLTAVNSTEVRDEAARLEVEFLSKPLDKQVLIALLERGVRRSQGVHGTLN